MHRLRPIALLLAWTAILQFTAAPALANPQGGQVVGGAAAIAGTGTPTVTVTQSTQNAVINWQSFNIGSGEKTQFIQPNATSTVLNRVIGDPNPSQIFGTLTANGQVYLINPNGVLIGNGATINTAGFLATTHDIANADFMAGRYNFNTPGNPSASVVNLGTITANNAGFAALVAPGVRNSGTIVATYGKVGLASANGFTLDPYGDQLITLSVSDSIAAQVTDVATGQTLQSLVKNEGTLSANGGRVELTAVAARQVVDSVINNTGVIEARSIGTQNGRIVLGAATAATKPAGAPKQTVRVAGTLRTASADGKGGTIKITGEDIQVAGASLDASGLTGGGKVLIGGDVGGGNPSPLIASMTQAQLENAAIPNATTVSIDGATTIDASAIGSGDGGKVVVWADGATAFGGNIVARGGAAGGNGGFVEVSGKEMLTFDGLVNVGASNGKGGTLLLDPLNGFIGTVAGPGVLLVSSIVNALATGHVFVTTDNTTGNEAGDLTVAAPIVYNSEYDLWLTAYRNVVINANITNNFSGVTSSGDRNEINVVADNTGTGVGTVIFNNNAKITSANDGGINIAFNPAPNNDPKYQNPTEDFSNNVILIGTNAKFNQHMLVNTPQDLQAVSNNLNANYVLGRDIDMSNFVGFVPIGNGSAFNGQFFGFGNTIFGLTINSALSDVGLFSKLGSTAEVSHLHIWGANVTATLAAGANVGVLAGANAGKIHDVDVWLSTVTATATAPTSDLNIGGVVGLNTNMMSRVEAVTVDITVPPAITSTGTINVGGLVGHNDTGGNIQKSSVGGIFAAVLGALFDPLVSTFGVNIKSDADGSDISIGGAIGRNNATASKLSTFGEITDNTFDAVVGGLIGTNTVNGTISESFAVFQLTNVTAGNAGGVVGVNDNNNVNAIANTYWNTDFFNSPGVGTNASTSSPTPLSTNDLLNGSYPGGFSNTDWSVVSGFYPFHTPEASNFAVLEPQGQSNPTIPDNIFTPPVFTDLPPSPSNDPPIVLASLNQPGPPGPPGPNPPIGPNGAIQNAVPGQTTFTPPPLPPRQVMGLGGETLSGMPPLNETRFVQNQVLLQMNINLPTDQLVAAAQRLGITIVANESLTNLGQRLINLQLPPGMTVRQAIRLMENNPAFPLATINGVYRTTQSADAPTRGDPAQYMIAKLGLAGAHKSATGKGITIAVIDSEVDKKHTELQGAVSEELNALGAKETPHSHGTAMAGAIASRDRLLGVAPDARILAVRAFGEASNTAEGTTVTIIKGIEWAVAQGARVINMSFAGPRDPSLERALKAARDKGVVLIAAAGNAGPKSPPLYPAADPSVIAVTATDSRDRIFRGANQGPQLSVAAPGVEILAPAPDSAYQMSTGTSIATAHVSGVVALLLERDPSLKPADVRKILEETANDLGTKGKDIQFGWGLVNPRKALEVVNARAKTTSSTVGGR